MIRRLSNKVKKFWAELALLSAEMIVVILLFLISLWGFVFIARNVFVLKNEVFDNQVFEMLGSHVSDRNNAIMLFFTFLGTHKFLIPANLVLMFYFLFLRKHRWYSIKVPTIALTSVGLMFFLKKVFGRVRPEIPLLKEASGLSFPSGHAFMSVTFYGLLIYIVWQTVKISWLRWMLAMLLLLLIFVIGLTRVYLRVHYPSDVLAGFATGFIWLVISIYTLRRIERYTNRKIDPVVRSQSVVTE
ncbi:MAG TPA: phosphatase PAP2 family protein [Chitinophagaceae bacterium]|nr:phosphatase PAP2 family protein [Chitinophagaceae bacterium]